jgi:hypothetical protein
MSRDVQATVYALLLQTREQLSETLALHTLASSNEYEVLRG